MRRRRFFTLAVKGALSAAVVAAASQVVRFLAFQPPHSGSTVVSVGQPDGFPRDSVAYVAQARAYVGHDAGGLYAMDAVCPHLGCLVQQAEKGGYACPCHDSRFDKEGQVVTGPATQSLPHLRLWFDPAQGRLYVDRAAPVEPSARLVL